MIRKIRWIFAEGTDSEVKGTNMVFLNKFIISKTRRKEKGIHIQGLGLYKVEREILERKFLKFTGVLNIYFCKYLFTYNKGGYKSQLRNVDIVEDKCIM